MPTGFMEWFEAKPAAYQLAAAIVMLLLATQVVVFLLGKLEDKKFGAVQLGILFTPLCTGFPNLMLGIFGQERLRGDLVLQLNVGNNIANTSLVTGVILLLAGPLWVRPGQGKSKRAQQANRDQTLAIIFFWLAAILTVYLAHDGLISLIDGASLTLFYLVYQWTVYRQRGKVPRKQRMTKTMWLWILSLLFLAAWLIHLGIEFMGASLDRLGGDVLPGWHLGLFLGLLTVVPESFLLLRLAWRKGSLGFSGLIGDCLVSIPLVIGLSSLVKPIQTAPLTSFFDDASKPYWYLAATMTAFTLLAYRREKVSRKVGLGFIALYAIVWWQTRT